MNESSGTRSDSQSFNHLADHNNVTAVAGKPGNAVQSALGSSKYLSVNDNASLSMGSGARMTVGAWVNLASLSSNGENIIAKRSYNAGNFEYFLRYEGFGNPKRFAFYVSRNGSNDYGTNLFYVLSNGTITANTWIFVAAGYDGSNLWISINNGPRVTTPYTLDIYNGTSPLSVGAAVDPLLGTPQFELWDGTIDEAFVYKRSLSANEVNWLYNNGSGKSYTDFTSSPSTLSLTSWWGLNETSGTRSDSQSSNNLADNNNVAGVAGKQGNAAQIVSATSKYLSVNDNDSISMGPGARLTVGAWVYLTSSSASKNIIAKRSYNAGNYEYFLRYEAYGSPQFAFYISRNGSNEYGTNLFSVASNSAVPLNTWIFVAAGYDGSNIWISVNGGPRNTVAYTQDIYNGTSPLAVGAAVDPLLGTPQFELWDGYIDEAFLYKRSLGQNELGWLYNSGAGRSYADVSSPPTLTGVTYTYDTVHKHAVASTDNGTPANPNDDNTYTYDANGNMTCRVEGGTTYKQDFNIENQLTLVSIMSGGCSGTVTSTTSFVYDGDGNLVKKIKPDTSKTIYVGGVYEEDRSSSGTLTHTRVYYPAGGAMRIDGTLYYVLRDHLGSASTVTDASGTTLGEQRYYPFGETRSTGVNMYTDKLYTGQRDTGLGIYYYNARFYSPCIMQFNQPDTIISELYNPQSLNRYSYVNNNPIRYNDPTGHMRVADQDMQLNHASMNCSKYSQYCNNGKPKSSDELAKMRNPTKGADDNRKDSPRCPTCILAGAAITIALAIPELVIGTGLILTPIDPAAPALDPVLGLVEVPMLYATWISLQLYGQGQDRSHEDVHIDWNPLHVTNPDIYH